MNKNKWKELWNGRAVDIENHNSDDRALILELKRSNGFDVVGELSYEVIIKQYGQIKEMLFPQNRTVSNRNYEKSVYEVGCGSGANLYLFEKDGYKCGGLDYSKSLIEGAGRVLHSTDLICTEADRLLEEPLYDALLSNSVFSYFKDEEYAITVLEKMYKKARYSIGLVDIHDKKKEQDFIEYRKREVNDYEERYRDLPKLFYSKEFFQNFAKAHELEIIFTDSDLEGYWNNEFIFNCFMYKRVEAV